MENFYFETKGLVVGYQGVPLIKNIELSLKRGEILTLIGPNGAGKTTILKSIIRQLPKVGGAVVLFGRNMEELTGKELSTRMSVVLTERVRPEMMTCGDVVATGRYPYTGKFGVLSEKDRQVVKESMELVHISGLEDQDFAKTSDGQKQRVMLARAICQEPDIIVLDEPTSFLDIRYKLEFLSVLQNMSRTRELSVIMSLHELDLAERVSHQVVCVRGDKVDRFGPPEEIFVPGYIPELYGITAGSFEALTGSLELKPVKGVPEVFVLAGNGSGTPVYRRLQRAGIPFATGILWENDVDYPAARALASEVTVLPPFVPAGEEAVSRAQRQIDGCGKVICTVDLGSLGAWGDPLRLLWEYARNQGKL